MYLFQIVVYLLFYYCFVDLKVCTMCYSFLSLVSKTSGLNLSLTQEERSNQNKTETHTHIHTHVKKTIKIKK